jgi:hypothetical protein
MDQTDVGLQSVVKALTDTIAGAIDPADHLAKEQLRLAAGYIEFVRQRLHYIHGRERYDLKHYIALAGKLLSFALPGAEAARFLRTTLSEAEPLANDPAALTGNIRAAAMELAHAVAGVVQEAHRSSWATARDIDRAVLVASEERLDLERLWYEPIGFEPTPHKGRLADYLI